MVTKKTFRHYRVLGKGGFGEVRKLICIIFIVVYHPNVITLVMVIVMVIHGEEGEKE